MKKISSLAILLAVSLILAACNIPQANTPTVDANAVSTAVAVELTAKAPTNSPVPPATDTPAIPPTNTPEPNTPTPTETATPTVTPTPPNDPSTTLGDPTYRNPLDDGKAFGITSAGYSDTYTSITATGSALRLSNSSANGWRGWRLTSKKPKNFYLEGKFNTINCSGTSQYGLVFRAPDYSSGYGYYLTITCDGAYFLSKWNADGSAVVEAGGTDPVIKGGPGQNNRFGIWVQDSTFRIYANGKLLKEFTDSSISDAGYIGAFIASFNATGITVDLDELTFWNLP